MRSIVAFAACISLAMVVTGCSSVDGTYLREGIGSDVSTPDLAEATRLQDIYVGEICRQAGMRVSQQGDVLLCDEVGMRPGDWATFVQAGMNDIDRRCDAYLTWLDNKRRWREPVLSEIATTAATTVAILGLTGVGATPIAVVGAAFGFAKESFINFQSRLLTQIDQSVVQSVVLGNQNIYRNDVAKLSVDNRPAAIYLLRGYLRICMPMSIEMHINNTMTVFQRGGAPALGANRPILAQVPTVAKTVAANAPLTTREVVRQPDRITLPSNDDYRLIIQNYERDPKKYPITFVEPALRKLCVPEKELRFIGEKTTVLIKIYQQVNSVNPTGLLTLTDIMRLNNANNCAPGRLNFYENTGLPAAGIRSPEIIALLNLKLTNGRKLTDKSTETEIRDRIPEVRAALGSKFSPQNSSVLKQLTPDLIDELGK